MNTCGLVSCIVPVYNGEKWLKKCIKSMQRQTYSNIEILLINDGSTDRSEEICLKAVKKDKRIRYFAHPNQGVSYTRNRGIALAGGEYVCFVDCDDTLEKNAINTLVDIMEAGDAQLAVGTIETVSKYSAIRFGFEPCVLDVETPDEKFLKFIFDMRSSSGYMAAKLYQSRIIKDNNLQFDSDIRCYEDSLFTYKYLECCKRCAVTDKVVYFYNRMNENAVTGVSQAFQRERFLWEIMKIHSQLTLFANEKFTAENEEYVQKIILRQFKNMCAYYARLSPEPEKDIADVQAQYQKLLRGTEKNEQYKQLYLSTGEIIALLSTEENVRVKRLKYRRALSAIKGKMQFWKKG